MKRRTTTLRTPILLAIAIVALAGDTAYALRLGDICRVKGQEENTLQGLGLVVGLKGTGDGKDPSTLAAVADVMKAMGHPIPTEDASNVALVIVTATIPAAGGRQGDLLNCRVSAVNQAKSLSGGTLLMTPLLGPLMPQPARATTETIGPGDQRIYAFAQGKIHIDDTTELTTGSIVSGCRLEEEFFNRFVNGETITLVLDKDHASFQTAQDIADRVNTQVQYYRDDDRADELFAKAIDQVNISVRIPSKDDLDDPVAFVSQILALRLLAPQSEARVVVNESTGAIVVGSEVEIGPVAITHGNVTIETGGADTSKRFIGMGTDLSEVENARLDALVTTLNSIKVPDQDIIEIIKDLKRSGKLYGRLIIQ